MCGFSGWILNTEISTDNIVSSLRAIKHRGPDDTLIVTTDKSATFIVVIYQTIIHNLPIH